MYYISEECYSWIPFQWFAAKYYLLQGALAQRRSNFQADHFPFATEVARKAVGGPTRNRPFNRRTVNWNKPRYIIFVVLSFALAS